VLKLHIFEANLFSILEILSTDTSSLLDLTIFYFVTKEAKGIPIIRDTKKKTMSSSHQYQEKKALDQRVRISKQKMEFQENFVAFGREFEKTRYSNARKYFQDWKQENSSKYKTQEELVEAGRLVLIQYLEDNVKPLIEAEKTRLAEFLERADQEPEIDEVVQRALKHLLHRAGPGEGGEIIRGWINGKSEEDTQDVNASC